MVVIGAVGDAKASYTAYMPDFVATGWGVGFSSENSFKRSPMNHECRPEAWGLTTGCWTVKAPERAPYVRCARNISASGDEPV